MAVYGVMVNNENVLLTDGTSGKPVFFADELTNIPEGMTSRMRWQELTDRIQQVYDIVTSSGSQADAVVKLAEIQAKSLSDEDALKVQALYDEWSGNGVSYETGDRLNYQGSLYKVLDNHKSQLDMLPDSTPALYTKLDSASVS